MFGRMEFGISICKGKRRLANSDEDLLVAHEVGNFEIGEAVKTHQGPIACLKQVIYPTG